MNPTQNSPKRRQEKQLSARRKHWNHMQVTDRPSPDAPSLTQAIIVQMVYYRLFWPSGLKRSKTVITGPRSWISPTKNTEAQWPIGYGVGLRIKRSSVRIRPWPLRWVFGQGSLLPLSQGEAFKLASISYLAILAKYILAKKKKKRTQQADFFSPGSIFNKMLLRKIKEDEEQLLFTQCTSPLPLLPYLTLTFNGIFALPR